MTWGSSQSALTTEMVSSPGAPQQLQRWGGEVGVIKCNVARSVVLPDTVTGSRGNLQESRRWLMTGNTGGLNKHGGQTRTGGSPGSNVLSRIPARATLLD